MSELNTELDQSLADNKELLCAISERTQLKLPKTRVKFTDISIDIDNETHNAVDNVTETMTETGDMESEQDHLGCSSSQTSTLTNEQLIERIQEMGDRFRNMQSSTANSSFQRAMSCAVSSLPNRQDISVMTEWRFRDLIKTVTKFMSDAATGKLIYSSLACRNH